MEQDKYLFSTTRIPGTPHRSFRPRHHVPTRRDRPERPPAHCGRARRRAALPADRFDLYLSSSLAVSDQMSVFVSKLVEAVDELQDLLATEHDG
jgi:hypothetical protein